jgi:hypothetical protein
LAGSREIDQDDLRLRDAGFDANAPVSAALAKLAEMRGREGVSDLAIARALGRIADAGAAAMLAEMEAGAGGALRREIRRSLFKLRQRGIAAPAVSEAPREPASAPAAGLEALLSPIDPEGARIVWIVKPRPQGGVTRLWGLESEEEGLVGATVAGLSRKELRIERDELERRAGAKLIDTDPRLADFILCEAYRCTPEARRARVGNFLALRAELIASPPPTELDHPVYHELADSLAEEPPPELLKEPELIGWKLPAADIQPYVDEIAKVGQSTIVISPVHQQERVNTIVERAVSELLSGDRTRRIRRRLEDTAYYMLRDGRRRQAGWAAAAAARLRDGVDPRRVPVLEAFIRTQLATTAAAEEQRAREEPRLIMTPAEAMRASEARRRARQR